ncbi:superoxide dismutase family protein [Ekhidna sp.]
MKKLFVLPLLIIIACGPSETEEVSEPEIVAEAEIYSLNEVGDREYEMNETVVGKAEFFQTGDVVTIEISLSGMTPNTSKAIHIHEGSVELPGRHWNAGKFVAACNDRSLGNVWARPFIGDVGNVIIDREGNGRFTLQTDLWKLNSGDESDLLDRPIIVHENAQDFVEECDPAHDHTHGHANPKIGGGKITLVSDVARNIQSFVKQEQMPDFLICK